MHASLPLCVCLNVCVSDWVQMIGGAGDEGLMERKRRGRYEVMEGGGGVAQFNSEWLELAC